MVAGPEVGQGPKGKNRWSGRILRNTLRNNIYLKVTMK
jgi:hypothetical protein